MIGTLAVDGWTVTFGIQRGKAWAGWGPAQSLLAVPNVTGVTSNGARAPPPELAYVHQFGNVLRVQWQWQTGSQHKYTTHLSTCYSVQFSSLLH